MPTIIIQLYFNHPHHADTMSSLEHLDAAVSATCKSLNLGYCYSMTSWNNPQKPYESNGEIQFGLHYLSNNPPNLLVLRKQFHINLSKLDFHLNHMEAHIGTSDGKPYPLSALF
ncbi:MAG: hypothetical protein WAZ18_05610 [Alphaproteobacteria bacterium]